MIKKCIFSILIMFSAACSSSDSVSPMSEDSANKGDQAEGVVLHLGIDAGLLGEGVVMLVSKLQNLTDQEVVFLPWNTPFDRAVTGRFLSVGQVSDNELPIELKYLGPMAKRSAPTPKDYLAVAPGESIENRLDITNSYKFCAKRDYIVRFLNGIFDEQYEETKVNVSPATFSAGVALEKCTSK